jgi:hypothetical protein
MESESAVDSAIDDLEARTLSALPTSLLRLVYLASTRDYNSGRYWHAGLASEFSSPVAEMALEICHRKVFETLVVTSLDKLVEEVRDYTVQIKTPPEELLKTWRWLQPFRVLAPVRTDALNSGLFCSNMKIALEILAYGKPAPAIRGGAPRSE